MNQTQNEIEIKKRVYFFMHEDGFKGKDLEPIVLVDGDKIHLVFVKKKYPYDMYYAFQSKRYIKLWLDKKENLLVFIDNWSGDLFVPNPQKTEYMDGYSFTTTENAIICEDREGKKKTLVLEGFDIIPIIINQFSEHANAILYILCNKLS